jgi:hypothetical protein
MSRSVAVEMLDGRMFTNCDLVRARSRAVRVALESPTMTHLLHWDADVAGNATDVAGALNAMLESGHDLVGAPYPRRRLRWERVAREALSGCCSPDDLQAAAYDYPYGIADASENTLVEVSGGCVRVDWMAMGFTLMTRRCLERMWQHYAPTLSFGDVVDEHLSWTVALFQLLLPPQSPTPPFAVGPMLSEDYSFCRRWADIGGECQLYVGPGSPLHHVGPHVYRGVPEGVIHADR